MAKQFVYDKFDVREIDLEKIQEKPGQYIGRLGDAGALHCAKEIINNAIDECTNRRSPGSNIKIVLNEKTNELECTDDGRGIPFEIVETICTVLQSSSKFTRTEGGGASAGENGCGIKASNALGETFEVETSHDGKIGTLKFERGKKKGEMTFKKCGKDEHYTTFRFKPSPIFLGEPCIIKREGLIEWLEKMSFELPPSINIDLTILPKTSKDKKYHKAFKNKEGFGAYIKTKVKNNVTDFFEFADTAKVTETLTVRNENNPIGPLGTKYDVDREILLMFSFTMVEDPNNIFIDSFCNFVNTTEHGVHFDACKRSIIKYLTRATTDSFNNRDMKGLTITNKDVENALCLTVNINTDLNPQFEAQIKNKVGSGLLFDPIYNMTTTQLDEFFMRNPNALRSVTNIIKANARARLAGIKERRAVIKESKDPLKEWANPKLIPCNRAGKSGYKEIYLTEGDSAASESARYSNDIQSIFKFRGFPLNAWGVETVKVTGEKEGNTELRLLVQALGCNIGSQFSLDKLQYDKIIICTDSDADGFGISTLLCAFFLQHLPQVVMDGRLYKTIAPLYMLEGKKKTIKDENGKSKKVTEKIFVRSKLELIDKYEENISNHIRIRAKKNGTVISRSQFRELLQINRDYLDLLEKTAAHYTVDKDLIEFVLMCWDDKHMKIKLSKRLPEIKLANKGEVLVGVHNGKYQNLIVDNIFFRNIADLLKIRNNNPGQLLEYYVEELQGKEWVDLGPMTMGEMLAKCNKYYPTIISRFKGLGELDPEDLRDTAYNPHNRQLVRLTIEDLQRTIDKFELLHGNKVDGRKELYQNMEIDKDLLDN